MKGENLPKKGDKYKFKKSHLGYVVNEARGRTICDLICCEPPMKSVKKV